MRRKRSLGRFCRALLLAASVTALTVSAAHPQDLSDLNNQILENPQDAELNLRYARMAEQLGELRLALAAYERVLINEPDNEEAQRGYTRVRRVLEPEHTSWRVEVGARWDSNPGNLSTNEEEAYTGYARATMVDERRIGSQRWRTVATVDSEITPEIEELNYGYVGAQAGPIVDAGPNMAVIPAAGVAVASLDNVYYYSEVNLSATAEGHASGVSLWARARVGWRDYGEESTAEEGAYVEVMGAVSAPRIASDNDTLVFVPWLRWSDIDGSAYNFLNEEISPGQYAEFGLEAAYHYQVNDNVILSASVLGHDRRYSQTQVNGEDRHDTYVSPQASVTVRNVLPCNCSVKLSYRYRDNSSNDSLAEYEADQVSVSLFASF